MNYSSFHNNLGSGAENAGFNELVQPIDEIMAAHLQGE
jgi:hypothetical protein